MCPRSVAQRPIRCQATPAGPGATGQSSSSPVAASSTTEDGATSALRQATVGLNSMVERLKERIQTLEDQLDRGRRSQKMAAEMRLALEAEAQEVRSSDRRICVSPLPSSFIHICTRMTEHNCPHDPTYTHTQSTDLLPIASICKLKSLPLLTPRT